RPHDSPNCLISLGTGHKRAMKLSCNPVDTHLLAVGCGDHIARVFDRRCTRVRVRFSTAASAPSLGHTPVIQFAAPHSLVQSLPAMAGQHATCVAFSPDGKNLLVSYRGDWAY
ncbi:unnamed protein product, partial [Discosporangium mesarthrocarpum]